MQPEINTCLLLQTLCGNQLCHFLLLLICILKICHHSFYKLTYSVFRVTIIDFRKVGQKGLEKEDKVEGRKV